jgi:uncharacterized membrane protein
MRVAFGKFVAGRVILEGEPFEDGADVAVIAVDESRTFELSPEDEAELLEAIAEADRGELVDAEVVLRSLQRKG